MTVVLPVGPSTPIPDLEHEENSISVLANLYEKLVETDAEMGQQPWLAETWTNPDDLTWWIQIREGVRWHDGGILTASQVAERLRAAWLEGVGDATLADRPLPIESVAAESDRVVVVRTRRPISLTGPLARLHLWRRTETGEVVGTGPYRLVSLEPGRRVRLEAFADHWRGRPRVETLVFEVDADAEGRLRSLVGRAADLVVDPPHRALARIEADPDVQLVSRPGLRVILLGMPCAGGSATAAGGGNPFADVRVRRAVALAVDRERLVREGLGGRGAVVDQAITPAVVGHHARLPPMATDPSRSRELLVAAGRAGAWSTSLRYPVGKYRNLEAVSELIASDLGAIGIDVELRPLPFDQFMESLETESDGLFLLGWMTTWNAGHTYRYLARSGGASGGGGNPFGLRDPVIDGLLEEDLVTLDPNRSRELLEKVTERLAESMPFLALYRQDDLYAARRGLAFQPRADRRIVGASLRE